ncbi:MAG: chemotaxis response regulator protein-glutamate methylesterase [Pseudomonadota bacterium]
MACNVLVVDDSSFFCRTVAGIINRQPEFNVIGIANNGKEAIDKVLKLKPDIVTMDVEMPVMDGITALKEIMRLQPTVVVMFSSLTYEGAKMTVDALNAGAVDFVLKTYHDVSPNDPSAGKQLVDKLKEVANAKLKNITQLLKSQKSINPVNRHASKALPKKPVTHQHSVIVIGASTGGPLAIQEVLGKLPKNFPLPILITLHMPANFTQAYANRLNLQSQITIKEAVSGEAIRSGIAYIAPGGHQMILHGSSSSASIRILDADPRLNYQPCVDVTFASAARCYGKGVLAIVMTGMGADGREGAKIIKQNSGVVWSQDEASCVVYGMPGAVKLSGIADYEVILNEMANRLIEEAM